MKKSILVRFILYYLVFFVAGFFITVTIVPPSTANKGGFFIALFVIFAGLSIILLTIFIKYIFVPLRQIRTACREYSKGNFDYDGLHIKTSDEIGDVAESLEHMAKQLRDGRDYQKEFISNISHDFRSPLTSIKGYLEAMRDGVIPPEEYDYYLSVVLSETERLEHLSSELRDLNAWNSTSIQLIWEPFSMEKVISSTVETFSGTCDQKNIVLALQFPENSSMVYADKSKIQQVLYNLLDNAIKFSNENSRIIIRLSEKGDKLYCSVKDFGVGIPRENLNRIWQRFYKTDPSRGKDKTGSGIGLAIVKEIMLAHGENIEVISTEGAGSEFKFSLKKYIPEQDS